MIMITHQKHLADFYSKLKPKLSAHSYSPWLAPLPRLIVSATMGLLLSPIGCR
jgi:hypothetical protein